MNLLDYQHQYDLSNHHEFVSQHQIHFSQISRTRLIFAGKESVMNPIV